MVDVSSLVHLAGQSEDEGRGKVQD